MFKIFDSVAPLPGLRAVGPFPGVSLRETARLHQCSPAGTKMKKHVQGTHRESSGTSGRLPSSEIDDQGGAVAKYVFMMSAYLNTKFEHLFLIAA